MAKSIIPVKILIFQDNLGNNTDAILQYKLNEDGSISSPKTVSVKDAIDSGVLNSILASAISSAGQSEGI